MNFAKSICVTGMLLVIMAATAMNCSAEKYRSAAEIYKFGLRMEADGAKERAVKAYRVVADQYPNSKESTMALQRIISINGGNEAEERAASSRRSTERAAEQAQQASKNQQRKNCESSYSQCMAMCAGMSNDRPSWYEDPPRQACIYKCEASRRECN
jgi:hypothetical protein